MAAKRKPVVVIVSDEKLGNIQEVATQLVAEGMKVDRVMAATGAIAGSVAATKMSALRHVDGVMSVEEELTAQLPPPDSSIQ